MFFNLENLPVSIYVKYMSKINDIHDGTFKDILKYKYTAKNLLKVTLPEEIYNSIDLSKGINSRALHNFKRSSRSFNL